MSTFSLATHPWLQAITPEGPRLVSLREAFAGSEWTVIAAGGHLEDAAVHRLLLAVTYAALGDPPIYPQRFTEHRGQRVARWLDAHADEFDLLDPSAPFAQDAHPEDTQVLPAGMLDPTLGRERAVVTDHRPMDARPALPFHEAAVLLLVQQHYSMGGKHPGHSESFPQSPGNGLIEFRPVGTLAEVMTWARLPLTGMGEANWTYRPREDTPGVRGIRPESELDALTWLGRRITLHHDGTQITGAQMAPGWRRAPEEDADAPFDAGAGRRAMAVAASSTSKPMKAAPVEVTGFRASCGDPVDLTVAWERGSPGSFSGRVREALTLTPRKERPRIVATGQQVISQALWAGAFTTELPYTAGDGAERADLIVQARRKVRPFSDPSGADLMAHEEDVTPDEVEDALQVARYRRPSTVEDWPRDDLAMYANTGTDHGPAVTPEEMEMAPGSDLSFLNPLGGAAPDPIGPSDVNATSPDLTDALRRIWGTLRGSNALTDDLAALTRTGIPSTADVPLTVGLPVHQEATRLWVGLAATWLSVRRRNTTLTLDAATPAPVALRWASRGGDDPSPRRIVNTIASTPATPAALRAPLLEAVHAIAASPWSLSWRALHHDLAHWTPAMGAQWRSAFWEPPNRKITTEGEKEAS